MSENFPCDVHTQQIKSIEKRMEKVEQKTEDMVDMKITLARIAVLIENAETRDKDRDDLNRKQNETLDKINENLIKLNRDTEKNTTEIDNLKTQVGSVRTEISQVKENSSINLSVIVKNGIYGGLIAVITYWVTKLLGSR